MLIDFDDILIQPAIISTISSRSQINILYDNGRLPLMTAPMDTVINNINQPIFNELGITTVMPRIPHPDLNYVQTDYFYSYSLQDFEKIFLYNNVHIPKNQKVYALIDIANGHQENLFEIAKKAKIKYGDDLFLMVGNVANPSTFWNYTKINVDMVRIGIGNGNGCWDENTLVKVENGYKKIKDIEINDLVLTHNGTYEKVINTISYAENNNLLEINGHICTDNHELYVINKTDLDVVNENNYKEYAFFIEAKHVDENQHLILSWEI